MPRYDYQCEECDNTIEVTHSMKEEFKEKCECGGNYEKLISPPSIKFNGSGFYVNDYKGK
jgi:putative FmdB family regulatory protein